jgi:hypothetical protein
MSNVQACCLNRMRTPSLGEMKSALFVSPNFLERVAEPESSFHRVYLTYRKGRGIYIVGRRTRDRRSLAIDRRVVSGARLFPASCDGRNVLVARVTVRSRAMFGESLRFPQVEQSNRIPR